MKKLIVLLSFIALGLSTSFAQQGQKSIGVNLGYGSEIESFGLGAKFQYGITDPIRLEAAFNYFFENNHVNMWDLNLNFHYLFPLGSGFKVYPLAGLTYTNWHTEIGDWDETEGRVGANLGAGLQYDIASNLALNFDLKYQFVKDFDQVAFAFGIAYKF